MLVGIDDIGSVELIDHMGDDDRIVQAARVSVSGMRVVSDNSRLIRRLMKDKHTSPFEHVHFTFKIVAPLHVARQIVRHRTANWSEISARFTVLSDRSYIPMPHNVRLQHNSNKQMSGDVVDKDVAAEYVSRLTEHSLKSFEHYKWSLESGIARETSRLFVPVNTYTEWIWTMDLHNIMHFLRLRMAEDSQYETRMYANTIHWFVEGVCPITMSAFDESRI